MLEILNKDHKNDLCKECPSALKNTPIEGLVIIKGLEKDGDAYSNGTILDPENGKEYTCYIRLEDKNTLKIRGYVGFAVLGRTQYWYRAE